MIEQTKTLVEQWYPGATVVYGDSVAGHTPLLLRHKKNIVVKTIEEIGQMYIPMTNSNKETCILHDVEVFTETGWTAVKNVIRHKTPKQMYRVCTAHGIVDVTEDHSLLDNTGNTLKPSEVSVGMELMQKIPSLSDFSNIQGKNEYSVDDLFQKTNYNLENVKNFYKTLIIN